jgi:hypothetical protein
MRRELSDIIETVDGASWGEDVLSSRSALTEALEDGKVIFFPSSSIRLSEAELKFLSPDCVDPSAKNVAYSPETGVAKHAVGR